MKKYLLFLVCLVAVLCAACSDDAPKEKNQSIKSFIQVRLKH